MNFYTKVKIKNFVKRIIGRKYCISINHLFDHDRYYIIRRPVPWAGFFANYLDVVGHIKYAQLHGMKPVIDMENYPTLYSEEGIISGTRNGWEYFFLQPNSISLEEAYQSRNYILSDSSHYYEYLPYKEGNNYFEVDKNQIKQLNDEIIRIIPLKKEIINKLESEIVMKETDVIGVHVRGTDKRKTVKDHNIAADVQQYIDKTKEFLEKYKASQILLCCDEETTVNKFIDCFGSLVIVTNAYRSKDNDTVGIHLQNRSDIPMHKYNLGYEVLRDCYYLSKCDYLIFGHSNVTNTALIWNNGKYKDVSFVENDLYV